MAERATGKSGRRRSYVYRTAGRHQTSDKGGAEVRPEADQNHRKGRPGRRAWRWRRPTTEAQTEQINTLQTEVERLTAEVANQVKAAEGAPADNAEDPSHAEMRELLQQFTADAREMMECITAMEKENADLLERLALPPERENAA